MSTQIQLEKTTILSLSESWNYISSVINDTRVINPRINSDGEAEQSVVFELPQLQINLLSLKSVKN